MIVLLLFTIYHGTTNAPSFLTTDNDIRGSWHGCIFFFSYFSTSTYYT